MQEVQEGRAVIELFYWADKPYRSKQIVFATLDKDSGCGIQKIEFNNNEINEPLVGRYLLRKIDIAHISQNDGLSFQDFKDWFKSYDLSKPMVIIHFTKFRY